jgi:hypothetical protein
VKQNRRVFSCVFAPLQIVKKESRPDWSGFFSSEISLFNQLHLFRFDEIPRFDLVQADARRNRAHRLILPIPNNLIIPDRLLLVHQRFDHLPQDVEHPQFYLDRLG